MLKLFIFTEDQRWDTIRALGNPEIHTPNLDRLVTQGFHFNNAYGMGAMVGAVCLPSRTMLVEAQKEFGDPYPSFLERIVPNSVDTGPLPAARGRAAPGRAKKRTKTQ